jgi:UDP-N-acetylmuramoylalanine--D-glutamate ligase
MKVAILGYTDQGKSAYIYWKKQGHEVAICDSRPDIAVPEGVSTQLGEGFLRHLDRFDLVVRGAPTIHPRDIVAANSPDILAKVTSNTDEFMRVCPTKNIIGVTGTKGKGTTSSLIAKMLEAAGKRVHLGGNIGIPPLDMLRGNIQPDDWVVLELANFQLIDIKHSPRIGVCLMIAPEHLNWHKGMPEYIAAKSQLFAHQTLRDTAIYYADNETSHHIASASPGAKIPYYANPGAYIEDNHIVIDNQQICRVDQLKLLGQFNWQNACAAVTAVWQVVQDPIAIKSVLTTFGGLEHRLEFVREVEGVSYYDDSFGTTPETAIVAIESFKQPKVIILGGSDKGASFDELAKAVVGHNVRQVVVIGDTAPRIAKALKDQGFDAVIPGGVTMPEIVKTAAEAAKSGDVVLLSTASASFGLFANYKDRGEQFKLAVGAL